MTIDRPFSKRLEEVDQVAVPVVVHLDGAGARVFVHEHTASAAEDGDEALMVWHEIENLRGKTGFPTRIRKDRVRHSGVPSVLAEVLV